MAVNDHALVVGINSYPGLSDLQGPVDDAERFAAWLINTPGVDVPKTNVSKLLTNVFHPPGPESYVDARPTASDFLGYFTRVLERQVESNQGQPGRRLYLYLSGHGFQGPTLHDIAVYSSHLPLDAHASLGNNALLASALGLVPTALLRHSRELRSASPVRVTSKRPV